MASTTRLAALALVATTGLVFASCRGATAILLDLHTNVPCTGGAAWHGVAIYVGHPGIDVETRAPTTSTTSCDASGDIGTLAVVPQDTNDAEIGVRVVAGITRPPEECAANGYAGCIVARRTLSFSPHDELDLRVDLQADCAGVGCDPLRSCASGACVDSREDVGDLPTPDAGKAGPVRCGTTVEGPWCATEGDVCCLTVDVAGGTASGACKPAAECPPTSIVLRCDASSQCTETDDAGEPYACCLDYKGQVPDSNDPLEISGATCVSRSACELGNNGQRPFFVCDDRLQCPDGHPCTQASDHMPSYFWCAYMP